MRIPARSIPTRTGRQSWSNGASMEPATLGRAAVPPALTPIREGRMRLGKCYGSFAITLPSNATQKLQIVRAPNDPLVSVAKLLSSVGRLQSIISDGILAVAISRENFKNHLGIGLRQIHQKILLKGKNHSDTSSAQTRNPDKVAGPNVWVRGTSAASRPCAMRTRPIRGALLRGSKAYQRSPR